MDKQVVYNETELKDILLKNSSKIEEICNDGDSCPEWFYKFIINFLTSIDMSEEETKEQYFNILTHKYYLSEKMERNIGFRVATLDYFLNITKHFINPKLVEITLFEQILDMSKVDSKTGCFNFRFFKEMLDGEIKRAERYEHSSSVILLDLDNFKEVNDKYGHLFADKVLEKMAKIIKNTLRKEDIIARYGGDEFVILLPHTGRVGARFMGERLKENILKYFEDKVYQGAPFRVTFSAGIATYPFDARDPENLINCADRALYRSKTLGKNCIYDFLEEEYKRNNTFHSDRRKYTRYPIKKHNKVEIYDECGLLAISGRIINISAGGVLLECSCKVKDDILNKSLQLTLNELLEQENNSLEVSGNIVRLNKEHQNLKFYIGLKFNHLLDKNIWQKIEQKILAHAV